MGGDSTSTVLWDLDDTICRQPASTDALPGEAFESAGVEPFFAAAEFEA